MKKIVKILQSRLVVFGFLILVQLAWIIVIFGRLINYSQIIQVLLKIVSLIAVLWIVNKEENPSYKIAWIIPILCLPVFGGLLYLVAGHKRPARKLRRKLEEEERRTADELVQKEGIIEEVREVEPAVAGQMQYLSRTGGFPVHSHTETRYYRAGEELYPDLIEELRAAKHFIFIEFFIISFGKMWDTILEILEEKVEEGVEVRVIYDDLGNISYLPGGYDRQLEAKGIRCIAFNPFVPILSLVMNNRDHRKIIVIDGHTAFSGGSKLSDEYMNAKVRYGHWKDSSFMLYGEAVWNYTVMFLRTWNAIRHDDEDYSAYRVHVWHPEEFEGEGYVQPYGDSPLDDEILAENVYLNILSQAERYVYIFTPYLIIDHEMQTALCLAAKRGVDVRLITPGVPDKKVIYEVTRSTYNVLIESGVRIFEYQPGFSHAKSYVCDDKVAVVGSINMDYRSLYLHFECGTYFYNDPIVMKVKQDCLLTFEMCREVHPGDTEKGVIEKLFRAVLRLFAPLM